MNSGKPHLQEVDIRTALQAAAHPALRRLSCCITDDGVVLTGEVPSFYLKQLAQSLLKNRLGHKQLLQNQLVVARG